jgi:hypothetical protein
MMEPNKTADEWINTCEYVHPSSTFKECPFCERDALRAEVELLKELLCSKLEDYNAEGKTILDFYAVWHRQDKDALTRSKAELAAAVDALRKIATHPIYVIDSVEIVQIARAFLARMEVKP